MKKYLLIVTTLLIISISYIFYLKLYSYPNYEKERIELKKEEEKVWLEDFLESEWSIEDKQKKEFKEYINFYKWENENLYDFIYWKNDFEYKLEVLEDLSLDQIKILNNFIKTDYINKWGVFDPFNNIKWFYKFLENKWILVSFWSEENNIVQCIEIKYWNLLFSNIDIASTEGILEQNNLRDLKWKSIILYKKEIEKNDFICAETL